MQSGQGLSVIWEFLSRDVALWQGLHSPMLSWIGSGALVVFFVWHVTRLVAGVGTLQRCYARLWPILQKLAGARKTLGTEWISIQALAEANKQSRQQIVRPSRIDLDDLQTLDVAVRREPLLERAWFHYRKTFIVERTAWFIEPRVFSTRAASEFFSQDLLNQRLNVSFYHQLPSLITGIGLLFTFLAILIGLSKLHADGSHIVGIQGLINGLAGKFLTSIVGLICANLFVLIEKSVLHRFTVGQQQFLATMDELFPRKTMEQMLENFNPSAQPQSASTPAAGPAAPDLSDRLTTSLNDRLNPAITSLTMAVNSLMKRGEDERAPVYERLADEVARAIKQELASPIDDLKIAVQALTRSLDGAETPHERVPLSATYSNQVPYDPMLEDQDEGEHEESDGAMAGLRWFAKSGTNGRS